MEGACQVGSKPSTENAPLGTESYSSNHAPHLERTLVEVRQAADAAGLSNSVGPVQLLHFSSQLHLEDIRIMEIEEPILTALKSGEK